MLIQQPTTYHEILLAARHSLGQLSQWHCPGFDCQAGAVETISRWGRPPAVAQKKEDTLAAIRMDLGECRRCSLSSDRNQIVFGEGDAGAPIVFVGHSPAADEDQSGRPFSGPAGELLDRIIQAMKLSRDRVYLCDVVKCRPAGDRAPAPQEIRACRSFWERQIAVIRPKAICALGALAAQTLLDTVQPLAELRGRFHDRNGIKVMPTFHPEELLKNSELKRAVWEDVKKIMALLRIPL